MSMGCSCRASILPEVSSMPARALPVPTSTAAISLVIVLIPQLRTDPSANEATPAYHEKRRLLPFPRAQDLVRPGRRDWRRQNQMRACLPLVPLRLLRDYPQ